MPRGAAPGLKPSRPGIAQSSRSTQRIVLPAGAANARINSTKPLSMAAPTGRINLPIGMILRCLPPEVLASDISEFEASGAAATEIGLPMNMILSQLPSGKVEMTLQDLVPHFPAGYLQPTESIASYLPNLINLPLMDVVMRIPPDLLALRPDQKDVDAAVINMADPFTEEILREQAEAARRAAAQPNIIEESQAPQEEFVPRDQQVAKAPAPAQRPPSIALPTSRPPSAALPTNSVSAPPPPMPQVTKPSAPPVSGTVSRQTAPIPPGAPSATSRTISASGRLAAAPTRATTAIPTRSTSPLPPRPQGPITSPIQPSAVVQPAIPPTASLPPAARQTASIPSPRPINSMPPISRPAPVAPAAFTPPPAPVTAPEPSMAAVITPPDNSSADLQRLAALAMAEMGEAENTGTPVSLESPTEALPLTEATTSAVTQPVPHFTPPPAPEPELESVPEPVAAVEPEPEPFIQPADEPEPEPASVPPLQPPQVRFAATPPSVPAPLPVPVAPAIPAEAPQPTMAPQSTKISTATGSVPLPSGSVAFNLNTCTADDLVQNIPGCFPELAASIVQHRNTIGSFKRLEDLLDVPGMTKAAYTNLTGEAPPDNRILLSLSELLGFPTEQHITLKDVTDRIACWPDVTGCVLSQSTGLSLVGTVPDGLDKAAIVAFAPRMFDALNKSFAEITGSETDALLIPTPGNSFHIFRNKDLYLIILSRLPQMPERHMKVARFVLSALSVRRD